MDEFEEETALLSVDEGRKHSHGTVMTNGFPLNTSTLLENEKGNLHDERYKQECSFGSSYSHDMMLDQIDSGGQPDTKKKNIKKALSRCQLSPKAKDNLRILKIAVLFASMFVCTVFFTLKDEVEPHSEVFPVSSTLAFLNNITNLNGNTILKVKFSGPLSGPADLNSTENVTLSLLADDESPDAPSVIGSVAYYINREFPFADSSNWQEWEERFKLDNRDTAYALLFESNVADIVTLSSHYTLMPPSANQEVILAAIILVAVYVLIGFELVHRTTAAILGAFAVLAILTSFNERPTLEMVMEWLDYDTLALLWGMMTIVAIFSETGFFDYCALLSYKWAKGKIWTLITILCFFSGIVSAFLDNVTTILLLTPVTISLCEVLDIDPRYVLIAEVVFSNIGGTATAIGDPPNVIIVSNSEIEEAHIRYPRILGINFASFTLHMSIGIVFCMLIGYFVLRILYRGIKLHSVEAPEIRELKHEIWVWRQAAARIMAASKEEKTMKALLMQKVYQLETELRNHIYECRRNSNVDVNWKDKLAELETKYRITDRVLLAKCTFVLTVTIILFFTHSLIEGIYLNLGWIAVIGAVALLLLADVHDIEIVMHRVEWATLLFFAALFVLMEGLTELGLIQFIGDVVADLIEKVPQTSRLTVAIILILWVSALASSFIDNIPFTTAMIPIVLDLSEREELQLPLEPLVWSLAFGACLGGNGTLIGASANVVCAGIADQHGYGFSFVAFLRVGFPMMLATTLVAMIYLLVCHSWIGWN